MSESFVRELSQSLRPIQPVAFGRLALELLAVLLVSFVVVALALADVGAMKLKFADPLVAGELVFNLLLVVAAFLLSVSFAYPERLKSRLLRPILVLSFLGYTAFVLATVVRDRAFFQFNADVLAHSWECILCILSFALVPTVWTVWRLRRMATTTPSYLGCMVILGSAGAGCLGARLVEEYTHPVELLLWHYFPLLLLTSTGLAAGRKIFRW